MCSRFEMSATPSDVARRFHLLTVPERLPGPLVRPTDWALVVGPSRRVRFLRFGLPVSWQKAPLINARAESLREKAFFRPLLGARCLVPATCWLEWRKDDPANPKTPKHKTVLRPTDGEAFALAGLVQEGHFLIVTCAPAEAIAHVHDRMPVVLRPQDEARWLDPALDFEQVEPLLAPYPEALDALEEGAEPDAPSQDLFGA